MEILKQEYSLWKTIFGQHKYVVRFFVIAILFYILNVSMSIYSQFGYAGDFFDIIRLYTQGFFLSVGVASFSCTVILSVLTGFLISLLWFRAEITHMGIQKKLGFFGYISVFLGLFVTGCPTCGLGLIAILGLGASVASLPFKGIEISIGAIIIILITIYFISKRILFCKVTKCVTGKHY